ncbi:hypothetical protein HPP92_021140 [Vanilla planifolia]|uniref:RRM domain-containing protein n=1 Tax=Vanilla planifolia TaxID=51239 RepID=A0A835PXK3_VANPL|nr:hypothetical protein HPP92_021140 [Vanilla planifolia]
MMVQRARFVSMLMLCSTLTRRNARDFSSKLFVGGLSYDTNETILKDVFSPYGQIMEVKVVCDHRSGKSKGFGFVRFAQNAEARAALEKVDGQSVDGRNIRVCYVNKEAKEAK